MRSPQLVPATHVWLGGRSYRWDDLQREGRRWDLAAGVLQEGKYRLGLIQFLRTLTSQEGRWLDKPKVDEDSIEDGWGSNEAFQCKPTPLEVRTRFLQCNSSSDTANRGLAIGRTALLGQITL